METAMDYTAALFDIDGTLLDSASLWEDIPAEYLRERGLRAMDDVQGIFSRMGYSRSARYLQEHYLPEEDPHAIMDGFCRIASHKYAGGVAEKPSAAAYLRHLRGKGIRCVAVTSNLRDIVLPALDRLHMLESIDSVTSIYDVGLDKRSPEIFRFMADKLGVPARRCVVFEDALFAAESAKKAGMCVIGVYDHCAAALWPRLMETVDRAIITYEELIEDDVFA